MEAATASQGAWEIHRAASIEFEQKQKAVQVLFKNINKHIMKSRFDMILIFTYFFFGVVVWWSLDLTPVWEVRVRIPLWYYGSLGK